MKTKKNIIAVLLIFDSIFNMHMRMNKNVLIKNRR